MDSHTLEGLTARLEAAERGLRSARRAMWMGSLLIVAATGGAAWWLTRAQVTGTPETLEAQHFIVRDAEGGARAVLQQSAGGSTQLVFFQDPLPGDEWRKHTATGPFSFGVRSLTTASQLMLSSRDGGNFQLSPGTLGFVDSTGQPHLWVEGRGSRFILQDSTGNMHVLSAAQIARVLTTQASKISPPPKQRRRR